MKWNLAKGKKRKWTVREKGVGNWNMKLHLGRVLTDKEDNKDKCCSEDSFEEEALGHSHVAWQKCGSSICFFLWFEKKNVFKTDFPSYGLGRKKHTANGKTAMTRKGKERKKSENWKQFWNLTNISSSNWSQALWEDVQNSINNGNLTEQHESKCDLFFEWIK